MDTLESLLELFQAHEETLMVLLTAGLLLSGIGSLMVAAYLARENRLLRRAGTEPEVVGYLLPDQRHINVIKFHLKNVGKGPAAKIAFKVLGDQEKCKKGGVKLPLEGERPPLALLPQDETISMFFGIGWKLLKEPQPGPVTLEITYENIAGQRFRRNVVLDARQFEGFTFVGSRAEDEIADALKKIEQHLGHWGNGFKKLYVKAGTPQDWRDEAEQERRMWAEHERADREAKEAETSQDDQLPNAGKH